jgi:hypothetical protein
MIPTLQVMHFSVSVPSTKGNLLLKNYQQKRMAFPVLTNHRLAFSPHIFPDGNALRFRRLTLLSHS